MEDIVGEPDRQTLGHIMETPGGNAEVESRGSPVLLNAHGIMEVPSR